MKWGIYRQIEYCMHSSKIETKQRTEYFACLASFSTDFELNVYIYCELSIWRLSLSKWLDRRRHQLKASAEDISCSWLKTNTCLLLFKHIVNIHLDCTRCKFVPSPFVYTKRGKSYIFLVDNGMHTKFAFHYLFVLSLSSHLIVDVITRSFPQKRSSLLWKK